MLNGQQLTVYTDHKNLMQDALGLTSDCVYHWRLLLEDGPTIVYIKGIHNTVADVISRLDYGPVPEDRSTMMTLPNAGVTTPLAKKKVHHHTNPLRNCLLYTSDAADD